MNQIKLRGADYLVQILECLEVEQLFAYPGGAILPLYDALAFSNIHATLVRHEQAAAFAAIGYARIAQKPGFCLSTSGPGATNMVTGIADAYADSIPLVALTGQVAVPFIGSDAFQEIDITGICIPITKKTYILKDLKDAERIFREAYTIAISGRPGPVLIDIPKDLQAQVITLAADWRSNFQMPEKQELCNVGPEVLLEVKQLLMEAKQPLIIAGHGVLISSAWEELRDFAHRERIPVISTILGLGAMDPSDPLYFSWLGMHGMKYANMAVQEADLILALGIRFDDRITGKLDHFAPYAKIIHADIDISECGKNVRTRVFLHSDLKPLFSMLPDTADEFTLPNRELWIRRLNNYRKKYPLRKANRNKFTEVTALETLENLLDENCIIATDVGQHQMWAAQYLRNMAPNHFVTSAGLGSMGFGLPAALGAHAAAPQHEVWCISGDGSFQMNLQELITAVDENWPIKILLLDNEYLGMVRQWQEQFYEKNYSGVKLRNPDFAKLAAAYHMESVAVDSAKGLEEAILRAKETNGPFLIHAKVLKEENVLPMVAPGTSLSDTIYYPDAEEEMNILAKTVFSQ